MRELEALLQTMYDSKLSLVKEVREFLPILREQTPLPLLNKMFGEWESHVIKNRAKAMMVVRE